MRTRALVGAASAAVAVGLLAVLVVPVVRSSDAATTDLRVAADNPLPPETAPLPATVRPLWTVSSTAARSPVEGPTAVATGADRVAGLDPATGRERWAYRRGNARLCDTTLQDGVVLALFAKSHGCRDLIGLDAATGSRRWTRTVEFTTDAVLTSGPSVAVTTGGDKMIAVDTGSGLNRWTWSAGSGCRLDPPTAGRVAVATVAHCAGEDRLIVHDPYADRAPWVSPEPAGSEPRVVAAEDEVARAQQGGRHAGAGRLPAAGGRRTTSRRRPGPARCATPGWRTRRAVRWPPSPTARSVALWTGQRLVAVDTRARRVRWTAAATGPPVVVEGQVLTADAAGFTARPVLTGTPATRVPAAGGLPATAALSRIGRLVVAAGAGQLAAFG